MTERVEDNPILSNQEVEHRVEEKTIDVSPSVDSNSASSVVNHNQDNTSAIDTKNDDNRSENGSSKTCEQKNDTNLNSIPVQPLGSDAIFGTIKSLSVQNYRDDNSDDNSDSSDSDSSSTVSEENDDSDNTSLSELTDKKAFSYARTRGELTLADLPPIEDLTITVEESKCKPIGSVFNMVDTMVIVQSFPNTQPLDIDTVLFLDRGQRPLGKIFDVFGPVHEPLYCVRFNSPEHIREKNITKEQVVYCAPQTEYTSFIRTADLLKNKGSDASWMDNNEPPVSCLDFSDDEEEALSKRSKQVPGSKRGSQVENEQFVKKMNQKNLELTAKRKKEDEAKQKRSPIIRRVMSNTSSAVEMVNMNSQSCFPPFTTNDTYKLKATRPFSGDSSRLSNFHHTTNNTHANKFDGPSQSVNYVVGGYSSTPSNYSFPPQQFLCSSPRQLPNVVPAAQNYLTVYSRPPMPSAMAPYSSYSSTSIPPLTSFPPQPPPQMHHRPMAQTMHPQFSNFTPLSAIPLPTTMPQANYYSCPDAPPVPQQAFIPLNVRPTLSASFHQQFAMPPPPPPPLPTTQHLPQSRDNSRPDRRPQSTHQSNSFYPTSYNS